MATLNNLIVNGDSRFIGDIQGTNFNVSGSNISINGTTILRNSTWGEQLTIERTGSPGNSVIKYTNTSDGSLGWLGVTGSADPLGKGVLLFSNGVSNYKIWHEGNDGSGSGLDADKVDGLHVVKITQAAYDALTTKDANTLYFIYD